MMKFNEVLNAVKGSDLTLLTEGETYFTVENAEGFRAYCQAEVYGNELENLDYYKGYSFSTVHQPNRKTGTGYRLITEAKINDETALFKLLDRTLENSTARINSGRERKDTRKPHENGKYLI